MPLKIFHTADVHVGMAFGRYDGVSNDLINARFQILDTLVELATERGCELFVVAGDLFNAVTLKAKAVDRVASILSSFSGCVAVLPGNHDYYSESTDSLWKRFRKKADNIVFLGEPEPYDLRAHDIDAAIYPGPCDRKRSEKHAVGWLDTEEKLSEVAFHIVVAHGSVEGLSIDAQGDYFPMTKADLAALPVDVVLLGHTHRHFPEKPTASNRIFMPGTPEPDGLDCAHGGTAWIITLDKDKKPKAELCEDLGAYRFMREEVDLGSKADVTSLDKRLARGDAESTLLDLTVAGRLTEEDAATLDAAQDRWKDVFAWLDVDRDRLGSRIDEKAVKTRFAKGSFGHELLMNLAAATDDEEDEHAEEALQVAYEILRRVGAES